MSDVSPIEWTDSTWNPIAGCSLKSPGCANCYAMPTARRHEPMMAALGRVSPYAGLTRVVNGKAVWTGEMRLVEAALTLPLRWRRPRRIFVNSMSDLFHEDVPDEWIDQVFTVMRLAPQHTFQVLTKRSDRMRVYLAQFEQRGRYVVSSTRSQIGLDPRDGNRFLLLDEGQRWPLKNVWLGVSAEDQRRADERVPDLLATPAAVRFVSAEPLLGPIDFTNLGQEANRFGDERQDALRGWVYDEDPQDGSAHGITPGYGRLSWIIVGGESGPGARPMHPDWARKIRDACAAAGAAFHFKQHGAWLALSQGAIDERDRKMLHQGTPDGRDVLYRVGKGAAGRLLDGVEHNGFPEARS